MQSSASTFILIFGDLLAPFSAVEYIGAENAFCWYLGQIFMIFGANLAS